MNYHPNNLKLQPYDHDKVIKLADMAASLGIQFKIAGIPFGAAYDKALWDEFLGHSSGGESAGRMGG